MRPLQVDIFWDADALSGVVLNVVDGLRMLNRLAAMRRPRASAPVVWRWRPLNTGPLPRWLPRAQAPAGSVWRSARLGQCKREVADIAILPGWHARSGPHLDQLVMASSAVLPWLAQVHAAGGRIAAVFNGSALVARAGLLDGRQAAVPWPFMASVLRQSDRVRIEHHQPWLVDERIWTCDSPVWATELLLDLLRQTAVADLAESMAQVLLPTRGRLLASTLHVHERILPAGALSLQRRGSPDCGPARTPPTAHRTQAWG